MENLAVNGNVLLWDARYAEALVWFERAFAAGTPAPWMYSRGARAAAGANEPQKALDYLGHAIAAASAMWRNCWGQSVLPACTRNPHGVTWWRRYASDEPIRRRDFTAIKKIHRQ